MNVRMIGHWALLALLALSTPAFAQTTGPLPIYGSQLAPGWDSWSWAEVTLGVRASGDERPIQVDADAWEALYLHHAPFSTSGYSNLSFWINGGQGGQTLSIIAFDGAGEAINDRPFRFVAPTNSWRRIEVPLSEIDAADATISGFLIQNATPSTAPTFFVNEIGLF